MMRDVLLNMIGLLSLFFSYICLSSSSFLDVDFFNLFGLFHHIINDVDLFLFFVSLFLFSVSLAIAFYTLLRRKRKSYLSLYPFVILAVSIFFLLGRDTFSLLLSLYSFCVAVVVYYWYFRKKEIYIKVPYANLVQRASKSFLTYVFLFVVIGAGYYAYHHPQIYEKNIDDFIYNVTGIHLEDINAIEKEIQQQQYQQAYSFAKDIGNYILYTIYNDVTLQQQEKMKCLRVVNRSLDAFNENLKQQILHYKMSNTALESIDDINYILSLTSSLYPLFLALTLFFMFEIIIFIVGVFTYIITSLLRSFY